MQRAGRCRGTAAFGPHLEFQPCDQRTCETLSVSETPSVAISAPICSPTSGAAANAQPHRTAIARFPHMSDRGPTGIGRRANVRTVCRGGFRKFPEVSGRGTEGRRWERLRSLWRGEAMGGTPRFRAGSICRLTLTPAASRGGTLADAFICHARLMAWSPSARGCRAQRLPLRAVPRRMPFQRSCDPQYAARHAAAPFPPQRIRVSVGPTVVRHVAPRGRTPRRITPRVEARHGRSSVLACRTLRVLSRCDGIALRGCPVRCTPGAAHLQPAAAR